ncbi:hypothetical protein RIF29_17528 [Crotalaria pallida]|uniref:non-specific serine/threonine protein kinase n=1 Tax=Crotalaria pallida TaxID=3830 RepID=A0AAN9FHG9_CROPI
MMISKKMMTVIMFLLCIGSQTLMFMPSTTVAQALSSSTDKLALLALKESLTNGIPDSLPSWNDSLHFCEWQGITCSPRHMRVSAMHLENQNWGGTLGPALGNLTFLTKLNLSNINLHGEIPKEVGRLKQLQLLDLRNNNLHGEVPIELSNCSKLQAILLSHNDLTGNIPSWFGSMSQLTQLLLSTNNLVGTIPASLGNLSSLVNMSLSKNHLEGVIPDALGKLSNLEVLFLGLNNLSGTVPHSLYNLSNIQSIDMGSNQLSGTILSNIHLAFPNLQHFLVGDNQFTGTFPSSISNLTGLQEFEIVLNFFEGPIPPTLGSLNKLYWFNIDSNNFGSARAHDLDFLYSLTNCTQLEFLSLGGNRFGGVLPDVISNLTTNLYYLNTRTNQIFGMIPEGIGRLTGLTTLYMGENFLQGTIPNSIGKLTNLVMLELDDNKLSGNIPPIIGNLTMLSEIYLYKNNFEGNIPFTLGYCSQLQTFSANGNYLSGNIPNQTFGSIKGLTNLDLSNNYLTGPIPSEFGNLKQLSVLYLSGNKLSGEIPMELGACTALTELILQRNLFQGSIPLFFVSLRSLDYLDLSHNNFSGTIPRELENLPFLNTLLLSFNHLHGEVPTGGVFNNMSAFSVAGNKDLCGGIPQLKLPTCPSLPSKKHNMALKRNIIVIIVIGGVLISFMCFMSVYCLHKKSKKLSSSPSMQKRYLRVSYGELHQATNGFSSSNLVGTGSFGSVYKGTLPHFEVPIAVKVLNLQSSGASKSFIAECKALGKIKHRNLVNLLTSCSSVDYKGEDFKAIVLKFMPNGSLESLLHSNEHESRNMNLNFAQMLSIANDVAHALDYLHHDSEQCVVHCDIKPSNILLDDDYVAHLGDFGLAKLLYGATSDSNGDQSCSSTIKGTIGYVPPEYGAASPVTAQGDIYSYGILLLEMLTGRRPTDSMFGESLSLHKFCNMAIPEGITEIADSRLLIQSDEEQSRVGKEQNMVDNIRECLVSFARIGVACSAEFSNQRMSIKDVIAELHAIKQKLHRKEPSLRQRN